jgi:hypothetical protein
MKYLTTIFLTLVLVVSCSDSAVQDSNNSSPASPYVEYVWHSAGENFNAKNLAMLITKWNDIIDSAACEMNGANILTPTEKNENYDFIWVLLWPSVDARDACWNDWTINHATDWDKTTKGIMSYDQANAYMFEILPGKPPKEENTSGSFVNTFYFCNYNDGSDIDTLQEYRKDLAKIDTFSNNSWYVLLNPTFDTGENGSDFVWLDLWSSNKDKASDMAIWQETDLPAKADEMASCNEFSHNATVIR